MINKLKVNALVKQTELDCYNWIHEEGLFIVEKLEILDEENEEYLYQAYNINRKEWAIVATGQFILLDESVTKLPAIMDNFDIIIGNGSQVKGIKFKKE